MTQSNMRFQGLEQLSSPSSSHDSFFPRFLTNFQCSDLAQIWYAYSLQHSPGGYFAVFRNSEKNLLPPPMNLESFWVPPQFDKVKMLRSSSNFVCLFLTTFPRRVWFFQEGKSNHIPYQKAFGLKKARPSMTQHASKAFISNYCVAPTNNFCSHQLSKRGAWGKYFILRL